METSATMLQKLTSHIRVFTNPCRHAYENLRHTILNYSDNMLEKNNGFDNAEQLIFDNLSLYLKSSVGCSKAIKYKCIPLKKRKTFMC
jgi:hypothetical protein